MMLKDKFTSKGFVYLTSICVFFFMRIFILLFLFPGCFHVPRHLSLPCVTGFKNCTLGLLIKTIVRLNKHRSNFKTPTYRGRAIFFISDCLVCSSVAQALKLNVNKLILFVSVKWSFLDTCL